MKVAGALGIVGLLIAGFSCQTEQEVKVYSVSYSFADSTFGWTGDFADYSQDSAGYHLHVGHDTLPYVINRDSTRLGLRLSGININKSGLFMFIKRKISGLSPHTTYQVLVSARLASKEPTGTPSGKSPGDSVYVKVGATAWEPQKILVDGVYQVNLDKSDNSGSGANMVTVGTIGVNAGTKDYTLIVRNNAMTSAVIADTDDRGELWIIVGTDSDHAGTTTLYYTQIDAVFNQN